MGGARGGYTAVFSVVTQRSGEERDDTKNGCVAD